MRVFKAGYNDRKGKARESPWAHLQRQNVSTDRRHDRRELTADEARRLPRAALRFGRADGEGFEPPLDFRPLQFSRLPENRPNDLAPQGIAANATDNVAFCVALLEADFPELARVIAGWPRLSEESRRAVAALVAAAGTGGEPTGHALPGGLTDTPRRPGWVEA